jgi:hypothetical protein
VLVREWVTVFTLYPTVRAGENLDTHGVKCQFHGLGQGHNGIVADVALNKSV